MVNEAELYEEGEAAFPFSGGFCDFLALTSARASEQAQDRA